MATTVGMTSAGSALVTGLLAASTIKYIGWGVGTTAYAEGQTALVSASAEARVGTNAGTQQTTDHANDTYQVQQTITCAGAPKAITEAGVFDQLAAGGNMYARAAFDAINVDVGDSIQFTFKVKHNHS